jgi:cyclase
MLKKRLIGVLPIKNGIVVQSLGFSRYLPVGKPSIAVEYLNRWSIDEIILLDIDAHREGRCISPGLVKEVSKHTFSPLTVGGGVRTTAQMTELVASGADKVAINGAAIEHTGLITQGAEILGAQCIIVSLDLKKSSPGKYELYRSGQRPTGIDPMKFAIEAEKRGAGEIFLNFIDRDGSKQGYDLEMASLISSQVNIPVILCGGVGHPKHFVEGLQVKSISAVAAGNFFHFTEHSVIMAKRFAQSLGAKDVRLDSYVNYSDNDFDELGRLQKKSDDKLEELFFEFHPKVSI